MADVKKQQKAKDKLSKLIQKFENKANKDKQRLVALASLIGMVSTLSHCYSVFLKRLLTPPFFFFHFLFQKKLISKPFMTTLTKNVC